MPPGIAPERLWAAAKLAMQVAPVSAIKAIGWLIRGKRVRGWNQLCRAAAKSPDYYRTWIRSSEPRHFELWSGQWPGGDDRVPAVLILGDEAEAIGDYRNTAASVRQAFGDGVPIYSYALPLDGCSHVPANTPIDGWLGGLAEKGAHRWILPLAAGDRVAPHLGRAWLKALEQWSQGSIFYWDEDIWNGQERTAPWVKPDWDEWLFLARDCLSGSAIFALEPAIAAAKELAGQATGKAAFSHLSALLAGQADPAPIHIPLILTHRSGPAGFAEPSERCAFLAHDWPTPIRCRPDQAFSAISPQDPAAWPSVSILIPTKDRGDLLDACLTGLRALQYSGGIEIILVDNGSTEARARSLLDAIGDEGAIRVVNAPGPFNFSALNNLAARQASGQLLCLLNNDVEAIDGAWLSRMVRFAMLDGVGAVGAQLLYPDGTIQHAGVAIGIGEAAGHIEKGRKLDDRSLPGWHGVTREVSAVTAACLLVRAEVYRDAGGLDEERFPVAFNDVDFCLRLKARGYRNLIVADATLIHHESVSRGDDWSPDNIDRFRSELARLQERWGTSGYPDPHFSPLFSRTSEQCLLAL